MASRNPAHITLGLTTLILLLLLLQTCDNPFAPSLRKGDPLENLLGNPATIEGFYKRFQNAYNLKDTSLYGPLLSRDFTFIYRDFESGVDVSWGKSEDIITTHNLFQSARDIDLTWNNVIAQFENEENTEAQIIRRFNLIVVLDGTDVFRTDGSANFILQRSDSISSWKLNRWRDQSDL